LPAAAASPAPASFPAQATRSLISLPVPLTWMFPAETYTVLPMYSAVTVTPSTVVVSAAS